MYILSVTEMAYRDDCSLYQSEFYASASIKATQPYVKYYTAQFTNSGFIISADG